MRCEKIQSLPQVTWRRNEVVHKRTDGRERELWVTLFGSGASLGLRMVVVCGLMNNLHSTVLLVVL